MTLSVKNYNPAKGQKKREDKAKVQNNIRSILSALFKQQRQTTKNEGIIKHSTRNSIPSWSKQIVVFNKPIACKKPNGNGFHNLMLSVESIKIFNHKFR